jgi:chromosome segregation ATPase
MRTYRSRDVKSDFLDDARTQLKNAQDELTTAQNYVYHLKVKLHEGDEQLEASWAQMAELQHAVKNLQELIPLELEELEEPEEEPGDQGCNTLIFKKIKIYQANAFHLNSNRKFLNNLIGCISWHAYFYF